MYRYNKLRLARRIRAHRMARQLQTGFTLQRDIRRHRHPLPREQIHGQRATGVVQQVGRKREHRRPLRVFPQQLTKDQPLN